MAMTFERAIREAEEEQIFEASRTLRLSEHDTAYVLSKHRRSPFMLGLIHVLGGGVGDYIRMQLEARPPLSRRR